MRELSHPGYRLKRDHAGKPFKTFVNEGHEIRDRKPYSKMSQLKTTTKPDLGFQLEILLKVAWWLRNRLKIQIPRLETSRD
ncbi:hypothetical protein TNCT_11101 [Trichonephila clavata]|uniref:Uncharacterized protein n=1 Tax=Trichonephila clavata TaxID=2740835 RepID=A0A8X6JCB9_TRICU|nr:hypothetical protein TNCT_11101 [Trichonephila clavata]